MNWRCSRQSKFLFFFFIVFFTTSLAYGNNPIRDVVRGVMERIIELSRARSQAYSGSWERCLNEAIRTVCEERGTTVSNKVIENVKNFLRTPESAKSYVILEKVKSGEVAEEWLSKKFISDWEAILKVYETAPPLEGRGHSRLAGYSGFDLRTHASPLEVARPAVGLSQLSISELSESGPRQAMLISYYSDEIATKANKLLNESGFPEFAFLKSAFEEIETFFKKKITPEQMTKERKRLILEDFIKPIILKLDDGILRGERGEKKLEGEVWNFMARLEELKRMIVNYGEIVKDPRLVFSNPVTHGLPFDLDMARMRYGSIEMKKEILSLWISDFKGDYFEDVFTKSFVLRDILSQPDNEFRKDALILFYENFSWLQKMPKLQTTLDGLWGESCRYFPGERGFDEAVETMIFLIENSDSQEFIPHLLRSSGVPLPKKQIALRALERLETESAFKILSESYFTDDFRNDLLNDPLLLETFFDALVAAIRQHPKHYEAGIRFLKMVIEEKDRKIQAELILALSQVPYADEERLLHTVTERVLQFHSHEDPNLRVVAALFLRRHGDDEKKRVGNQILGHVRANAELSSKLTDRSRRLILSIIPEDAKIPFKFKNEIVGFIRSEPDDLTVDALSVLCRLDDPAAAREAALKLLGIWDRVSPSDKRKIIHALLQSFPEDTGILKETLVKVIDFYRDPRYGFDLLDELSAHLSPVERLSKLSDIDNILSDLYKLKSESRENPRLLHFVDELITEIQNRLLNQPPPPF